MNTVFILHKMSGEEALVSALADAIGVFYNATGDLECFSPAAGANNETTVDGNNWNWQVTDYSWAISSADLLCPFFPDLSDWSVSRVAISAVLHQVSQGVSTVILGVIRKIGTLSKSQLYYMI